MVQQYQTNKLNYKSTEKAIITLTGKASEIVNLLIIDPSDKPKGESQSIKLGPDGRGSVTLDLKGYGVGVYTAVISKGGEQNEETFTIGLQTGSGQIDINTTKISYLTGDPILVLGETSPNVLLTITLTNPDGKEIKATSGSNFDTVDFEVNSLVIEGMIVSVSEGEDIPGYGKTINISVIGAQQTVEIEIIGANNKVIETLSFPASKSGEIKQPWKIPKDTEPGTYTIKVEDAFNSAETTFEIK